MQKEPNRNRFKAMALMSTILAQVVGTTQSLFFQEDGWTHVGVQNRFS